MIILNRIIGDEDGQGIVEYGLIIGLISLISIVSLSIIGRKTKDLYDFSKALPEGILDETNTAVVDESAPPAEESGGKSWFQRWLEYLFGKW